MKTRKYTEDDKRPITRKQCKRLACLGATLFPTRQREANELIVAMMITERAECGLRTGAFPWHTYETPDALAKFERMWERIQSR